MAQLTIQPAKRLANNLVWSAATVTTGDKFANTGREAVLVRNDSLASINVTITTPGTVDGLAISDKVIAVAAGKIALLGPFPRSPYADSADGNNTTLVCSAVTDVTLAAVKIP